MHSNDFDEILTFAVGKSKYPPDNSQRQVIKSINNTIVSAGAGSGKTEVLANRFAYLLMTDSDLHVRNILAITFTKKAASEIYERVFKKLNDYKKTLSDPKYNGKYIGKNKPVNLAQRALDEFSDARIQTLDSYSSDIVKLAVARYGIKPDFCIGEFSSEIDNMAKNFVLQFINNPLYQDAYKTYSQVGKIELFSKTYFSSPISEYTSIATEKNWFSKNFDLQIQQIINEWNLHFTKNENDDDDENSNTEKILNQIKTNYEKYKNDKQKDFGTCENSPYFIATLKTIQIAEKIDFSNLIISQKDFSNIDELSKKIKPITDWLNSINNISGNGSKKELKQAVALAKQNQKDRFNYYEKITSCASFINNFKATKQIFELMDIFLEEVNLKKKQKGILSFKDISELALKTLNEQKDILEQQQNQIKKIMIDEFQDNNKKNKELLDLLAGDSTEKLFFVGDEKQSIYKFRGADVSVFNGLKNSLKGNKNEQVLYEMNNNYRSTPELLKAFNEMFGDDKKKTPTQIPLDAQDQFYDMPSLFYLQNYLNVPEYEATYLKNFYDNKSNYATKPGKDGKDEVESINLAEKDDNGNYKNIKIHACILNSGTNSDDDNEKEGNAKSFKNYKKINAILDESETAAYFIAKKIKKLGPPYSNYAILDSSRTHRAALLKFLTSEEIPFTVDVQKNIFLEGIANDFHNFLKICIYPNDSNAFSAFLSSPFVCISQIGVENIMSAVFDKNKKYIDEDGNEIIKDFEVFADNINLDEIELSNLDKEKYIKAKQFYTNERYLILSSSITKTIERLWYNTGYFYETQINTNMQIYAEQFDLLYQIALQAENNKKNIEWFINQLEITKEKEKSFNPIEDTDLETADIHYPLEKQDAVTIMTIHQSKGLEFEKVFITGIFDNPKPEKQTEIYFEENKTGISLKANDGFSNYFFLKNIKDSKNKSLAEQKRLIYVAITRAKKEVFLVGDLAQSKDLEIQDSTKNPHYKANASCSLMHKLLRYYYTCEKGLYQNNDYSQEFLQLGKIEENPYYNETLNAPFDFIKINPVIATVRKKTAVPISEQKQEFKEKLTIFFTKNEKITTIIKEPFKTLSPSALELLEHKKIEKESSLAKKIAELNSKGQNPEYQLLNSFFADSNNNIKNQQDDDSEDEKIINENAKKSIFTRGTFGTMVHAYLEHWIKTNNYSNAEEYTTFEAEVTKIITELFSKSQHDLLSSVCKTMTKNFSTSFLGKKITDAKNKKRLCKAETNFKMMNDDTMFTGAIDLFFENEDKTLTLVDYKTDEKINPEKYFEQQKCYKNALEELYGINVEKCYLYYLRYDAELDITEELQD